ncbi:hypothetical protein [Saccharibacillus kuerlensis]|uniref:Uncharacterized protein n=1 Tax=Saccharibacillus kuerlensis TaxID=459527 RepID=A0ABQ2LBH6_9BACL|nr:hypothetical protein [Saccharibacillus kuerlensis]GGO08334.1 hypothetical protein GCM10010969_37690 [Saccharibacillus kuerlensis]
MIVSMLAWGFAFLIAVVVIFQAALALGAPWGEYAMGGKFPGKYPLQMRIACLVQIVILIGVGLIVLSRADQVLTGWSAFADKAIWFAVAFSVVATIMNLMTRSVWERRIWAPVSGLMLLTSLGVALG